MDENTTVAFPPIRSRKPSSNDSAGWAEESIRLYELGRIAEAATAAQISQAIARRQANESGAKLTQALLDEVCELRQQLSELRDDVSSVVRATPTLPVVPTVCVEGRHPCKMSVQDDDGSPD